MCSLLSRHITRFQFLEGEKTFPSFPVTTLDYEAPRMHSASIISLQRLAFFSTLLPLFFSSYNHQLPSLSHRLLPSKSPPPRVNRATPSQVDRLPRRPAPLSRTAAWSSSLRSLPVVSSSYSAPSDFQPPSECFACLPLPLPARIPMREERRPLAVEGINRRTWTPP